MLSPREFPQHFATNARSLPLAVLHCCCSCLFCFDLLRLEQYISPPVHLGLCFCLVKEGVCLWSRNPRRADRQVLESSIPCSKVVNCAPWPMVSNWRGRTLKFRSNKSWMSFSDHLPHLSLHKESSTFHLKRSSSVHCFFQHATSMARNVSSMIERYCRISFYRHPLCHY